MYQVFDPFLAVSTWHTRHPSDETRFFRALVGVHQEPAFNADQMGDYMRKYGNRGCRRKRRTGPVDRSVRH